MTTGTPPPAARFTRDAWVVVGGQSVSTVGDAMLLLVLPLLVLDLTGSPWQVGLVVVVAELPAFAGFLAGWPRRFLPARTLLVGYDLARAGLVVAMAVAVEAGAGLLPLVYALAFGVNLASTLFRPTRIEFITHVVPPPALRSFNSYDRTLEALAMAAGAGLGGLAYGVLPLPAVFAVCAATFAVAGTSLLTLRRPAEPAGSTAAERVQTSFRTAIASVRHRRVPAYLIAGETLTGVSFGVFLATFVVYAREFLAVSSTTFGLFEATQALAATAAGVVLGLGRFRLPDETLAVAGYLGMGASMLLLGANSLVWPVFLVMVGLGVTNMLYAVSVRTLLQTHCAEQELIHVFAAESTLSRAAQIGGAAGAGALLSFSGLPVGWLLAIGGMVVALVGAWGYRVLLPAGAPVSGAAVRP